MNINDYFDCHHEECFQNKHGKCFLLTEPTKKQKKGYKCPFYKTLEQLQKEEKELYGRVLHFDKEYYGC